MMIRKRTFYLAPLPWKDLKRNVWLNSCGKVLLGNYGINSADLTWLFWKPFVLCSVLCYHNEHERVVKFIFGRERKKLVLLFMFIKLISWACSRRHIVPETTKWNLYEKPFLVVSFVHKNLHWSETYAIWYIVSN